MKLIAFLNKTRNDYFREAVGEDFFANGGYANGYVAVPPEHPYYGKDYDNVPVEIHGGLTFDSDAASINLSTTGDWDNLEFLGEETSLPNDFWVFGFDTLHYGDGITNWPRERCVEETLNLKEQLEKMSNNIVFK